MRKEMIEVKMTENDSDFGGNETGCNCDEDVVLKMLGRFCSFYHYIFSNGDNLKF